MIIKIDYEKCTRRELVLLRAIIKGLTLEVTKQRKLYYTRLKHAETHDKKIAASQNDRNWRTVSTRLRCAYLAYAALRGRTYQSVERKTHHHIRYDCLQRDILRYIHCGWHDVRSWRSIEDCPWTIEKITTWLNSRSE